MGKTTELNSDLILFDFEIYVFNMFVYVEMHWPSKAVLEISRGRKPEKK